MLNVPQSPISTYQAQPVREPVAFKVIDFDRLLSVARRQVWIVVACAILGLVLGVIYLVTAVPIYTASVDILIDKSRTQVIDQMTASPDALQDESETLSQVELLKSEELARNVIKRLGLTENKAFMAGNPSIIAVASGGARQLIDLAISAIGGGSLRIGDQDAVRERGINDAIRILQNNTTVLRVGRTYVLRLQYESADRVLAASIAQAFGNAYLEDQLQSKFDATTRAGGWLQDRIAELKQQAFDADIKVQKFRTDNNLISAGGQLVSEQQLSEINTQLISAQAATAEAKARMEQIEGLIANGQTDAVVNDALVSSTINTLRDRYLNTSRIKTEIEAKLGPNHIQVIRLKNELSEIERLIFGELQRIAVSYRSSYNVALSRQQSLEQSLKAIVDVNATANTTQVQLRELEREAETFKTLYDSFLKRYQETVQQQSFPISDARVITHASEPDKPSSPKKTISLAMFLALGLASGAGLAAFREYRDRFFRTGDQIRSELRTEFLGFMPAVTKASRKAKGSLVSDGSLSLWSPGDVNAYVRSHPMSAFAEALRNIKVAADMALPDHKSKVIGVVSCLPFEGKSTVSSNLGILLAMQGARVALVDGDLRNPGLTRSLALAPQNGLIEAITDPTASQTLPLLSDLSMRLSVLPVVLKRPVSHTSEMLSSAQMGLVMSTLKNDNDYVIVDLPPTGPVVDAKAFANRIDAFVFVVEWGKTSRGLVRSTIENNAVFRDKCLGVILNKADAGRMKLYSSVGSEEYYASRYHSYYQS